MRKIKRVLPTTAMCRGSFWTAFSRVREYYFSHIDEVLADPRLASAIIPPCHMCESEEKIRFGAYLTWMRDHGVKPDFRDDEEWEAFLRLNETFPLRPDALKAYDIIHSYPPSE